MTLNTTELIARVRYPYGAFDQTHHDLANALESTVKEMHARELHHFEEEKLRAEAEAKLREAEQERDEARWAAGIVGDVARESSGGWQDAAAELHATQARLREAEAVIEKVRSMLPGPRTFAESLPRDFAGNLWPRTIDADDVAAILATYKPTNQEESKK